MKLLSFLSIICILFSCSSKKEFNSKSGKIKLTDYTDSISFVNTDSSVNDSIKLKRIVDDVCYYSKVRVKNPLTFKPISVQISRDYLLDTTLSVDTNKPKFTIVDLTFQASNSYGVPGLLTAYCPFKLINDTTNGVIDEYSFIFEK